MYLLRSSSLLAACAFAVVALAACSADATIDAAEAVVVAPTADQVDQAPQPDEPATVAPTITAVEAAEPAAPAQPEASSGGGTVEITLSNGRSWTLETGDCYTEPDSPFGVFFMSGTNADGAELNVVESWPLDGDRSGGTAFIATFVDEAETLYFAEGGPVSEAGGVLSFESPVFEGLALEATLTGVFSCTP